MNSLQDSVTPAGLKPPVQGTGVALVSHPDCARHEMGSWHPEAPERLSAIQDQLIASGIEGFLVPVSAPRASEEDLVRVHPAAYIESIRASVPETGYVPLDPDTLMCPATFEAVLRAAGGAAWATDLVLSGEVGAAFCAVRPPGHHARVRSAMGFCFVNNIAVAAKRALAVHGLERVAIVDFDVHHGNGTEEIFAGDERVLMVSFFQHPFYPFSGTESPAPNMINVPVPAGADGDAVRDVVATQWIPALDRFKPQMVFISAGFDAHREDDLGQMRLVEEDYAWITRQIVDVAARHAHGRIVSCLEGGYNLSSLARSVVAHLRALAQI